MQTDKIEVTQKSMCVPLWVIRSGKRGLTISCDDPEHQFGIYTFDEGLKNFRNKLEELFVELVDHTAND